MTNMKYLIGLILIALPSYLIRFSVLGIPTTVLEISIYILAISYLFLVAGRNARWYLPDRSWLYPIALFIAGALIGALISPDKRLSLGQFKAFIFDPLLFVLVLYSALRSKIIDQNWIPKCLIWGGVLVSALVWVMPADPEGRSLSVFNFEVSPNANYLSLFLAPIFVLAVSNLKTKFLFSKIATFENVAVLFIALALLTSESRGGLLGVSLGLLYLFYRRIKQPRLKTTAIAIACVLVAAIGYLSRPDLLATPDSGRVATSNNIRYEIWTTTAEIITPKGPFWGRNSQNFVLGVGLGNYQNYFTNLTKNRVNYPEFIAPRALTPHNIFLAMWVNGGILMLAGFVWLIFLVLRRSGFIAAQAALVALIGHGLVDTPYFKNDLAILFWLLIALCLFEND